MTKRPLLLCYLLDRPGQCCAQVFPEHCPTGFADGRQSMERPLTRTALPQLAHQETIRQHDQVHVPGLALGITQLTVAEAELLLTVPMKGLRTCPAMPVHPHDPTHFPGDPIGHQDLAGLVIVPIPPENHDPNLVLHVGDTHTHREVPLPFVTNPHLLAVSRRDRGRQVTGLDGLSIPLQLAVALEVADVAPGPSQAILLAVNMIEDLGTGEVRVHREVAGDLVLANPVDQFTAQYSVVAERLIQGLAYLLLAEESELEGIVLAAGADIVGEEVVLSNLVPFFGVVPEPPGVRNQQAVAIDQGVINRNDALVAVPRRGIFLELLQSPLVESTDVPLGIREESVEAGLIGGLGEFAVDPKHRLALGHHQSGEILSEVSPLAFVGEHTTVLSQGILHDLGKFDDSWHEQMLHTPFAPGEKWSKHVPFPPFLHG